MNNKPGEWTVLSMLNWATKYFEKRGVKSPRLSIEWLLAHTLDVKRLDLYLNHERPLSKKELSKLREFVKRRADQEPLQYIIGEAHFYNARILVNPSVLIPRQETELLVDMVLKENEDYSKKLIDLGTGSGCIPIAIKKERSKWDVYGCDISGEALNTAIKNALLNDVDVNFFRHSFFEELSGSEFSKIDIVVSNPPYILIEEKDMLDEEVKKYEPHLALFCESTQKVYKALEQFCSKYLSDNGRAYFETHENYAKEACNIFWEKGWTAKTQKDLENKDRFIIIQH